MNSLRKLALLSFVFSAALAGTACTGQTPLYRSATGRSIPANAIVIGTNERVTLNALTAKRNEYWCSNGMALQCERLSFKLRCTCPSYSAN